MTDKEIGFNRHIYLPWLDETAALCSTINDPAEIRQCLEAILAPNIQGVETRRKAIDILLKIWFKTKTTFPRLWQDAMDSFQTTSPNERIWLHYGLTLVAYPFVRECLQIIGQSSRSGSTFTKIMVRDRLIAQRGQLGSLERSLRYVLASLRQWGVIIGTNHKYVYQANTQAFTTNQSSLELWLLACSLQAHPAETVPYPDLLRLMELFPFRFTVTIDHLRTNKKFVIHREGSGWEMVGLTSRI